MGRLVLDAQAYAGRCSQFGSMAGGPGTLNAWAGRRASPAASINQALAVGPGRSTATG